jgi:hypothetical protein
MTTRRVYYPRTLLMITEFYAASVTTDRRYSDQILRSYTRTKTNPTYQH